MNMKTSRTRWLLLGTALLGVAFALMAQGERATPALMLLPNYGSSFKAHARGANRARSGSHG
jgi:hypothetical protein